MPLLDLPLQSPRDLQLNGDPIVLTLQGKVPSKKNRYTPQKNGKGFFKNKDLQAEIDRLASAGWRACQDPVNIALRFSWKALTPSRKSSELRKRL